MNSSLQYFGDAQILLNYHYSAGYPATRDEPGADAELWVESASMSLSVAGELVQCEVPIESFTDAQLEEWAEAIRQEIDEERTASEEILAELRAEAS